MMRRDSQLPLHGLAPRACRGCGRGGHTTVCGCRKPCPGHHHVVIRGIPGELKPAGHFGVRQEHLMFPMAGFRTRFPSVTPRGRSRCLRTGSFQRYFGQTLIKILPDQFAAGPARRDPRRDQGLAASGTTGPDHGRCRRQHRGAWATSHGPGGFTRHVTQCHGQVTVVIKLQSGLETAPAVVYAQAISSGKRLPHHDGPPSLCWIASRRARQVSAYRR